MYYFVTLRFSNLKFNHIIGINFDRNFYSKSEMGDTKRFFDVEILQYIYH